MGNFTDISHGSTFTSKVQSCQEHRICLSFNALSKKENTKQNKKKNRQHCGVDESRDSVLLILAELIISNKKGLFLLNVVILDSRHLFPPSLSRHSGELSFTQECKVHCLSGKLQVWRPQTTDEDFLCAHVMCPLCSQAKQHILPATVHSRHIVVSQGSSRALNNDVPIRSKLGLMNDYV